MPPCALIQCANANKPYDGPTNARGSNGLVLLTMLPMVMVVGVTPTSDAVLGPVDDPVAPGPPPPPGTWPPVPPVPESPVPPLPATAEPSVPPVPPATVPEPADALG